MKKYNTDLPYIISNYYINQLVNELDAFEENEIEMSWLSYGGSVWAGNQFADYLQTTEKKIDARVTGLAASMGAALIPYFNKATVARQADIMIHSVSSSVGKLARKSNQELYDALKSKINEDKFEKITGHKLKDIMFLEGEDRIDVWVSGKEAYDFGLFEELIDLTPEEKVSNDAMLNELKLTANLDYELPERLQHKSEITNKNNKKSMDKNKLKTEHPELYAEVLKEGENSGVTAGIKTEKDRVDAWMVFNDVDPEKVKAGIESGKEMTKAEELAFLRASHTLEMQKSLEELSSENVDPNKKTGKPKNEAEKEAEKLDDALESAGISKEGDK